MILDDKQLIQLIIIFLIVYGMVSFSFGILFGAWLERKKL